MRTFRFVKDAESKKKNSGGKKKKTEPVAIDWGSLGVPESGGSDWHVDAEQQEAIEQHRVGIEEYKARRRQFLERRRQTRQAYGILHGDPRALLKWMAEGGVGSMPDEAAASISPYHRSMPQFRERRDSLGRLKIERVKELLESPGSGYTQHVIPVESYAHNEHWKRIAPKGMKVFIKNDKLPSSGIKVRSLESSPILEARRLADMKKAVTQLRQETGGYEVIDSLNPNHPLNIFEAEGPEAMFARIFTDRHQFARPTSEKVIESAVGESGEPQEVKVDPLSLTSICTCGSAEDRHVTPEEATEHHALTGEHLEIHPFSPQYIMERDGTPTPGRVFRAGNSMLLRAKTTPKRGDNALEVPATEWKRMDDGMGYRLMPLVKLGETAERIRRILIKGTGRDKDGREVMPFIKPDSDNWTTCKGSELTGPCYGGKLKPRRSTSAIPCDCCEPDVVNRDPETGNPISVGLGNGRIRILDDAHKPLCPTCNGQGFKLKGSKSESEKIDCETCAGKGTDPAADSSVGIPCTNCGTSNGAILTTDDNRCPICKGTGKGIEKVKPRAQQQEVFLRQDSVVEGNPVVLEEFSAKGHGNSGVDAWKAHAHPQCTRCGGDDEYQTDSGLPCNCRIASFDDKKSLVAPSNMRFVTPEGVSVPNGLFQFAMTKAYPEEGTNPHRFVNDFETIDPSTDLPYDIELPSDDPDRETENVVRYQNSSGGRIDARNYLGHYENGINIPESAMKWLQERSAQHRSSRNAKFCAANAELEDIYSLLTKHIAEYPINIPGLKVEKPKAQTLGNGSISGPSLHKSVQEAIPQIAQSLQSAGVNPESVEMAPVLEAASNLQFARDAGHPEDEHWDNYNQALSRAVGGIFQNQRQDVPEGSYLTPSKIRSMLKGLPQPLDTQPDAQSQIPEQTADTNA